MTDGIRIRVTIPANEGRAFPAAAGEYITIVDLEGMQIGDVVFFSHDDIPEHLSTASTRRHLGRLTAGVGDHLWSNRERPLLTIVEDDVKAHDIVSHPCDRSRYEMDFGIAHHPNCRDNLAQATAEFGVEEWWMPDPFNVFMNTRFFDDGRYLTEPAISRAGDRIVLKAEMDVLVAISACPQDLYPANGYRITDLEATVAKRPSGRP